MKSLANPRDKAQIVGRLQTLKPDAPRRWGRMSVHQMVCHLSDSFRMALGDRRTAACTKPLRGAVLKAIALHLPVRWPAGISTTPEVDQERGGTPPADFASDLADLLALVDLFTARTGASEWPPHPIFGRMSEAAWLRWAYLHTDHHLRQFGA